MQILMKGMKRMVQHIYDILVNALYGSGATLEPYQDFVLTQLSTWMGVAVVLVPVIAMVAITVKLLKW